MNDTITQLTARELMCQMILQTILTAKGEYCSAAVSDVRDRAARMCEMQKARAWIDSDAFQEICDELPELPENFVERVRCQILKPLRVWQMELKSDRVEA